MKKEELKQILQEGEGQYCNENKNPVVINPGETFFSVELMAPETPLETDEITDKKQEKNGGLNGGIKLSKNQESLIKIIYESPDIILETLAEKVGIPLRSPERNIAELKQKGILK